MRRCGTSLGLVLVSVLMAQQGDVRFLRFSEVQDVLNAFSGSGFPGSDVKDASSWAPWIANHDREIRLRIDRGIEDSISNFILYGTSYTTLRRFETFEQAASVSGKLTAEARARIHALVAAVARQDDNNERVRFVREFLKRRMVTGHPEEGTEPYLAGNLQRFVSERRAYQEKLRVAGQSGDPAELLATRGTLFENRGLSVNTSLLPNFALEDTLRALARKAVLAAGSIRRIAVIGPGLDFTDKRDGYDFYPLQTIQPFAVMEGVLRLKLAEPDSLQVVTLDVNPFVNEHLKPLAERARAGQPCVLQLPRDSQANWSPDAIAYWEHFGEMIGSPARPLPVPASLGSVSLRAVSVRPRYAAQLVALDVDIVGETLDPAPGAGFDLVVATNVLVYYDLFQQALAMASIAHMMNRGGIFLANHALPAGHPQALEYLGRRSVSYSRSGAYGDDVVVYRRR